MAVSDVKSDKVDTTTIVADQVRGAPDQWHEDQAVRRRHMNLRRPGPRPIPANPTLRRGACRPRRPRHPPSCRCSRSPWWVFLFFFLIGQMQAAAAHEGHAVRRVQGEDRHQGRAQQDDLRRCTACRGVEELQGRTLGPSRSGPSAPNPQGRVVVRPAGRADPPRCGRREASVRSSPSPARTSSRCWWASARAAYATSSSRPRRTRRPSSSSTRSTRWAGTAVPGSAAVTTSASRP